MIIFEPTGRLQEGVNARKLVPLEACEERRRLTATYIAAVSRNNDVAGVMAHHFSEAWCDGWQIEMREIRDACQEGLRELDRHMNEHGC